MASVYPKAIMSANGNRTETVVDTYGIRKLQSGSQRRSRTASSDPRKRFRARMRAAARCNPSAAARWEMMKQIGQPTHGVKAARQRGAR